MPREIWEGGEAQGWGGEGGEQARKGIPEGGHREEAMGGGGEGITRSRRPRWDRG